MHCSLFFKESLILRRDDSLQLTESEREELIRLRAENEYIKVIILKMQRQHQ